VKHNFLSVPVLQKTKHKWFGFIDLADIVLYVVQVSRFSLHLVSVDHKEPFLTVHQNFGEEKLSMEEDFWKLVEREEEFQQKTVNDLMRYPLSRRNPFHPVKVGYSLLYAIEALAKEHNLHRIPGTVLQILIAVNFSVLGITSIILACSVFCILAFPLQSLIKTESW